MLNYFSLNNIKTYNMTKFKSLPKNARHYNLNGLPIGAIIYSPTSRNSYEITKMGSDGYFLVNQQTNLTCYIPISIFTRDCYTTNA